jgi:hypothetical protein
MDDKVELKLSRRTSKFVAFILDIMAIQVIAALVLVLLVFTVMAGAKVFAIFITYSTVILIFYIFKDIRGISIGKWVTGIMVRNEKNPENKPNALNLILRNLTIIIFPFEFFVFAITNKTIGDRISKSIVVDNTFCAKKIYRIIVTVIIIILFFWTNRPFVFVLR